MYICAEENVSKIQHLDLKTQNESKKNAPYVCAIYNLLSIRWHMSHCCSSFLSCSFSLCPSLFVLSLALILVGDLQESQIWCLAAYSKFCFGWGLLFLVPWFSGEIMLFGSVFVGTPLTSIVCNA